MSEWDNLPSVTIIACETCQHFACICGIQREHEESCKFRKAACCPVGIACDDHDRDVCPVCDPCTCTKKET